MAKSRKGTIKFIVEVQGDKAAQEYSKLNKQLIELTNKQTEFTKGSKEYEAVAKEIDKVNKSMKRLEPTYEALTKRKRALEQQLKRLTPGTQEFIDKQEELDEVREKWKKLKDEIKGVEKQQKKSGKETSKLGKLFKTVGKINPFGWIGVVIGALASLFAAFAKSKKGSDLLMKASSWLNATFGSLIRTVNDFIGAVGDIFTKSDKPLQDFGKLIADGIVARLRNAMKAIQALGGGFMKFIKGDFKGARNELEEAGKSFIGIISGKEGDALDKELKVVKETAKQHYEVAKAKRANAGNTARLAREVEILRAKEDELNSIADDGTLSIQEQQQATEAALIASEKRAAKEIELAKAQAALINNEMALQRKLGQDVHDLKAASMDASTAVLAAENELEALRRDNATKRRQLQIEAAQDELDLLIDGVDSYKAANERRLNDDNITFAERKKILDETAVEFEKSFGEQVAVIQRFTDEQINANDLINESDAKLLAEKVKGLNLSSDIQARLLEIIKERRAGLVDLTEAEQDLNGKRETERDRQIKAGEALFKKEMEAYAAKLEKEAQLEKENQDKKLLQEQNYQSAKENIEQQALQATTASFDAVIGLLSKDEEARKKNAQIIKTFEKAKVLTNLYAEISSIWRNSSSNPANAFFPGAAQLIAGVQTAAAVGRSVVAIRNINSQTFARGGYTGRGGRRDHTGHRVAGVVHDGEWVAPKWMTTSKKYRGIINALEGQRNRGFASGGFTSPNPQVGESVAMDSGKVLMALEKVNNSIQSFDRERQSYVVYDQFDLKQTEITNARNSAGW